MAVPKKRTSKAKKNKRKSIWHQNVITINGHSQYVLLKRVLQTFNNTPNEAPFSSGFSKNIEITESDQQNNKTREKLMWVINQFKPPLKRSKKPKKISREKALARTLRPPRVPKPTRNWFKVRNHKRRKKPFSIREPDQKGRINK